MEVIKLYNKSQKTFHTSLGEFKKESFLELPIAEANKLMVYPDIIDASTFTGDTTDLTLKEITIKELQLKIEKLEAENAELKAANSGKKAAPVASKEPEITKK
ncbi:MAG: hypothetical protein ACRC6O_13500 [Flavobacterium sp.]